MHKFLKFIFGIKPHISESSSVHRQEFLTVHTAISLRASRQQTCMTYTIAVCTAKNS